MTDHDQFYIGYQPVAPPRIARGVRHILVMLAVVIPATAALLAFSQRPADPGVFEYGHPRSFRGQLREFPYPSLVVPGPGVTDRKATYTRYLLVAQGKHGAGAMVGGLDGHWVDLTGTRIARPGREMLEVVPNGVAPAPAGAHSTNDFLPPAVDLGRETLSGEIVDSKCWLGVMKPATGNVHRGCAARCLHGGIPPLLMTTGAGGTVEHYLLTDARGAAAPEWFAGLVSRQVTLTGKVSQEGDLRVLRVEKVTVNWP